MAYWYSKDAIHQELIKFVILLTEHNDKFVIIKNKKRGGWEIPGGNREPGETILFAASRELYEETGAVRFSIEPFGIYCLNESYGMVFYAKVHEIAELPEFEIEEIKWVDRLPEGLNFGDMFYTMLNKWSEYTDKNSQLHHIDIKELNIKKYS